MNAFMNGHMKERSEGFAGSVANVYGTKGDSNERK
jgi:hypothetical protein